MKPESRFNKIGLWLMQISGFYKSEHEKSLRNSVQVLKNELQLIQDNKDKINKLTRSMFGSYK